MEQNHHPYTNYYPQYHQHPPPPPPHHPQPYPYQPPPGFHPFPDQFNGYPSHPPGFSHQPIAAPPPSQPFNSAGGGGAGGYRPDNDRKRPRPASPLEQNDGVGGYTKLYVSPVPRTITTEDMWPLFREYGNVIEVVFPMDKRQRLRAEYCFVKYSTRVEADQAIRALNGQYTIPGEALPIVVRYADVRRDNVGKVEAERVGGAAEKLYVGGINKLASKQEIREVFSVYGNVEDIYIGRDEMKQSRGFAFVKFSHMDMALAAIEALHGIFRMRGSDQPLIVRFADPLKPRPGDPRPSSSFSDSSRGFALPNASHPLQENSPNSQTYLAKQGPPLPQFPLQTHHTVEQLSSEHHQIPPVSVSETQKQAQYSRNLLGEQVPPAEALPSTESAQVACGPAVTLVASSCEATDLEDCDWSEHTCPDGDKYYYNCITCESRWEIPEEFAEFQKRRLRQEKLPDPDQRLSILPAVPAEVDHRSQMDLNRLHLRPEVNPVA